VLSVGAFPNSSEYTAKHKLLIEFERRIESAGKTGACSEHDVRFKMKKGAIWRYESLSLSPHDSLAET